MDRLRILLADDHINVRAHIRHVLEDRFDVVAEAGDGEAALRGVERLKPDVAVLDVVMPKLNGIEVARRIGELETRPTIVFLSVHTNQAIVEQALAAGGLAYVSKVAAAEELVKAIYEARAGHVTISTNITRNWL